MHWYYTLQDILVQHCPFQVFKMLRIYCQIEQILPDLSRQRTYLPKKKRTHAKCKWMDLKFLPLLDIQFECDCAFIFKFFKCAFLSSNDLFYSVSLDFSTSATFTLLILILLNSLELFLFLYAVHSYWYREHQSEKNKYLLLQDYSLFNLYPDEWARFLYYKWEIWDKCKSVTDIFSVSYWK